jgi:hypothetical protein
MGLIAPENPMITQLREHDVENLTPKQALDLLYELKKTSKSD